MFVVNTQDFTQVRIQPRFFETEFFLWKVQKLDPFAAIKHTLLIIIFKHFAGRI